MRIVRWLLLAAAVAALIWRLLAFRDGYWYGETPARLVTLFVAVAGAASLGSFWAARHPDAKPGEVVAVVAGAATIATGAYAAVQLLVPTTPEHAAARACSGAPVSGSRFLGQTPPEGSGYAGVNSRSGPATSYEQTDRFPLACTLGFDGYCVGSSVPDFLTKLPDQVWLILHRRQDFMADARIASQDPPSSLGVLPDRRCSKLGGLPLPERADLQANLLKNGQVALTATARNAVAIGYVVEPVTPTITGGYPYRPLPMGIEAPNFASTWNAPTTAQSLVRHAGIVMFAAQPCLAADIAAPVPATVGVARVVASRVVSLKLLPTVHPRDSDRLAREACAGPP